MNRRVPKANKLLEERDRCRGTDAETGSDGNRGRASFEAGEPPH
jgi:hypothetical protein